MPVAEGVDHQNVDVARHTEEVLRERGEHVPWVEVEEGGDKVETERRCQGNQDDTWSAAGEEAREEFVDAFARFDVGGVVASEGVYNQIEGLDDDVELNQAENAEGDDVTPSAALRSITQGQNELQQQERQVGVFEDRVEDRSDIVSKGERMVVVRAGRLADQVHNDDRCKIVRRCQTMLANAT